MELESTYATEVLVTCKGYLLIEQEDTETAEGVSSVLLSRDQARLVAKEVIRLDADDALWTVA